MPPLSLGKGVLETMRRAEGKRLAIVTMGVKLGDETRGYTRFRFLSEYLANAGFQVDLITSSFQHWDKAQRDVTRACYTGLPYKVVFIWEPGYTRNLDLKRIRSHKIAAAGMREYFKKHPNYSLIYCEMPPNDVARACMESAHELGIPFVVDINDLWPEAMRMVVNIPGVSDVAFSRFERDAKAVYEGLDAAVGTSDEYASRPAVDRSTPFVKETVYVGNDLAEFDQGVQDNADGISKPEGEFWAMYTGTLGASYDLLTLVKAAAVLAPEYPNLRVKILGDGPDREKLEIEAKRLKAPVDFLGYAPYTQMAAYLAKCDVTINSLKAKAPQSIVTKIADYLAAGKPMINTGSSPEMRAKVENDGFGVNVPAEDTAELAGALAALMDDPAACAAMGKRAREVAEAEFDRPKSYGRIVRLIESLLK